jgi:hypothetical protein
MVIAHEIAANPCRNDSGGWPTLRSWLGTIQTEGEWRMKSWAKISFHGVIKPRYCRRCEFPPFANCAKDGAPLSVDNTDEIKSLGPPALERIYSLVHGFREQIIVSKNGCGFGFDQLMPIGRKNFVSQKSDELAERTPMREGGKKPMLWAGDALNSPWPMAIDHDSLPATVS